VIPALLARDVVELLTLQLEGHPRIEERGMHEVADRDRQPFAMIRCVLACTASHLARRH
jgi:hypothetical protein